MAGVEALSARSSAKLPAGAPRVFFAFTIALAAVLRVGALGKPLYIDEIVTLTVATQPLASMAGVMRQIDASPALFPLLLHFWLTISHADVWARLLPAIFGLLAVPAVASVAARAFGWRTGLAAAALMAIAPAHIHYAQYVRGYSLFTLLVAIHVRLFLDWMDSERRITRGLVAAFVIVTAALLYTHYLSLLLLPSEGLFVLWRWRHARRTALAWTGAVAVAGLLFLPGVPLLLHNIAADRVRNADRPAPPPLVQLVPNLVADLTIGQQALGFDRPTTRRVTLGAAAVIFSVLWLTGAFRAARVRPEMLMLLTSVAWLPPLIYVLSGRRLVAVRFFVPFMLGYLSVLGCGLVTMNRSLARLAGAAVLVVCAIPLWHFYTQFAWSYDHRRVAQVMASQLQPGDVLLFVQPYESFYYRWYLGDRVPMQGHVFTALEDQPGYVIKPPPLELVRAEQRVMAAAQRHARLWIVGQSPRSFASDAKEEARLLAWMDQTFARTADLGYLTAGDPQIRRYVVPLGVPGAVR